LEVSRCQILSGSGNPAATKKDARLAGELASPTDFETRL
jgi:hypothetical protein